MDLAVKNLDLCSNFLRDIDDSIFCIDMSHNTD